jgi:iron(III) transport system substrate-binding protein
LLQDHFSPELGAYDDDAKVKGKSGVFAWTNREIYISLGYNTKLVSGAEAPKTLKDYLDPKWKGKMSIAGTTTGTQWIGAVSDAMGREFLEKLSGQEISVQNMSGAALSGLVASGEVPLSPTIFNSNIFTHKQKNAPVEWRPIDPVIAGVGSSGMIVNGPHPHAALLFLDYLHSKLGQEVAMKGGLSSARTDIGSLEQKFKKIYLETKYSPEELEKKFNEWEGLMRKLFIRQR